MIGERVVCVKEKALDSRIKVGRLFTIRETTVSGSGNEYYVVVSDNGDKIGWLDSSHFKPVSEVREEKLQDLGI